MKNTLDIFAKHFGTHSLESAKRRFAIASFTEMDKLCIELSSELGRIADQNAALWFLNHRSDAIVAHCRSQAVA